MLVSSINIGYSRYAEFKYVRIKMTIVSIVSSVLIYQSTLKRMLQPQLQLNLKLQLQRMPHSVISVRRNQVAEQRLQTGTVVTNALRCPL